MSSDNNTEGKGSMTVAGISWIIALWTLFVFVPTLPLKFSLTPMTQTIFGKVGTWTSGVFGSGIGDAFAAKGSYVIGSYELLTSIVLIIPAIAWVFSKPSGGSDGRGRAVWYALGGLMATAVIIGAAFFHLFTPLGTTVAFDDGTTDGGSLFKMAVSIAILGVVLFILNRRSLFGS